LRLPQSPRRPPIPPLFPYTTLFRSKELRRLGEAAALLGVRHAQSRGAQLARARAHGEIRFPTRAHGVEQPKHHVALARHGGAVEDRKSTRLNSSHQIISYAVFCLKK